MHSFQHMGGGAHFFRYQDQLIQNESVFLTRTRTGGNSYVGQNVGGGAPRQPGMNVPQQVPFSTWCGGQVLHHL